MSLEVATRHFFGLMARAQASRLNRFAKPIVHYSVRKTDRGPYRYYVERVTDRVEPLRPQFESREQRAARVKRLRDQL